MRQTKLDPARIERALELARTGMYANDIASQLGVLAETVRRWCLAANVKLASPRNRECDWAVVAEAADRSVAGESFAALGREYGVSERTLADRIRFELSQRALRAAGVEPKVSARGRRGSPESEAARYAPTNGGVRADGEPLVPAPMEWVKDLRPRGRRLVLELVDDGLGDVVLVARLEAAHAAPTCRRCATEASTRPALAQESWQPSAGTWAARALMMLAGMTTLRTEVRDHDGGQAK